MLVALMFTFEVKFHSSARVKHTMRENSSVSDTAALRREIRRRKILENSKNRLKLIEGINSHAYKSSSEELNSIDKSVLKDFSCDVNEDLRNFNSVPRDEINAKFKEAIKQNEHLKKISDFLLEEDDKLEESDDEETNFVTSQIEHHQNENSVVKILLKKRLHYVFLAFLVNVLFYFNLGYLFCENIFCPFYTMKGIELLALRGENQSVQPLLLLLLANLPKRLQNCCILLFAVLSALFSDLSLYIFTFVIGTKILNLQV